jgi:hypothetical protein
VSTLTQLQQPGAGWDNPTQAKRRCVQTALTITIRAVHVRIMTAARHARHAALGPHAAATRPCSRCAWVLVMYVSAAAAVAAFQLAHMSIPARNTKSRHQEKGQVKRRI